MSIEQEKMIVESLPSLYPLQEFEEKAIQTILDALPPAQQNLSEVEREQQDERSVQQLQNPQVVLSGGAGRGLDL
jgi:hypothetical protein